jgi:PPOX class probable F420-dependent enzyme
MADIPDSHKDILESKGFAHVATIGPDGAPQCTPVWFDWDGKQVKFSQVTTRQKYRNLQRDQRVSLSIQDPSNPYRSIEIRGTATFSEDTDRTFVDSLAKTYMDQDTYDYDQPGDIRMIVSVVPEHSTWFGE